MGCCRVLLVCCEPVILNDPWSTAGPDPVYMYPLGGSKSGTLVLFAKKRTRERSDFEKFARPQGASWDPCTGRKMEAPVPPFFIDLDTCMCKFAPVTTPTTSFHGLRTGGSTNHAARSQTRSRVRVWGVFAF